MALEGSLTSSIAALGIWKGSSFPPTWAASAAETLFHGNAIATHSNRMYLLNDSGGITGVNLAPNDPKSSIFATELQLPFPLKFPKKSIHLNKAGQLLAIVGATAVAVVQVPGLEAEDQGRPALCQSKALDLPLSLDPGTEIIKVAWHPLSNTHLAILTDDNTLRLFNIEFSDSGAEQTYHIDYEMQDEEEGEIKNVEIVNFCFGDASVPSWQAFSIYFLASDASVYALCPVVPYSAFIPFHYFNALKRSILAQRDDVLREKQQLDDRRGSQSPSKSLSIRQKYLESQLQWISIVSGSDIADHRALAESTVDVFTKNPRSHKQQSSFELIVQGPLDTEMAPSKSSQSAAILHPSVCVHDLFALSAVPTVLGRSYASGHVELLVAVSTQLTPAWTTKHGVFQVAKPQLLFWAGVDLSPSSGLASLDDVLLHDSHGLTLLPTPPTYLPNCVVSTEPHNSSDSYFYMYSSCGVVRIHVPWIKHIDDILSERIRARESPQTAIQLIWNGITIDQPLPLILGAAPYFKPLAPRFSNAALFLLAKYEATTQLITTFIARDPRVLQHARQLSEQFASAPSTATTLSSSKSELDAIIDAVKGTETEKKVFGTPSRPPPSPHHTTPSATTTDSSSRIKFDQHFADSLPTWPAPARLGPKTFKDSSDVFSNMAHLEFYKLLSRQFDACHVQLEEMAENMENRIMALKAASSKDEAEYQLVCDRAKSTAYSEIELVKRLQSAKAIQAGFVERLESLKAIFRFVADSRLPVDLPWLKELSSIQETLQKHSDAIGLMDANLDTVVGERKRILLKERGVPELNAQQADSLVEVLDAQHTNIESLVDTLKKLDMKMQNIETKH